MEKVIIIGAGIAGLGAAYALKNAGGAPVVLEKDSTWGGLCGNFEVQNFRFDRFVHFSFTKNEDVNAIFMQSSPNFYTHLPNPFNIYKRKWIKHPAQNNLFPLERKEKEKIISDFFKRSSLENLQIRNYEEWLRAQFGNYFAEHFPMVYTRKYWMSEAKDLETKWIGNRLYQPSLEEVILGSKTPKTPATYYAKEMRYPKNGGYKSFFLKLIEGQDIVYNSEVNLIDIFHHKIKTIGGKEYKYDRLISSAPLPEIIKMLENVPPKVKNAVDKLRCTSGYQISIGLKTMNIPSYLWWYIYDEDILPARVYSPSLKSLDNAPDGCSSLQLEIYCNEDQYSQTELYNRSVGELLKMGVIHEEDILFIDVRFERYANVIFDKYVYNSRKFVRDYLNDVGIETIGRFGEWDYLWSDQSLLSGLNIKL